MKVVIQCAGGKQPGAGRLIDDTGITGVFVAQPQFCESTDSRMKPCRPDDESGVAGVTWRDFLESYNERNRRDGSNPCNLLSAAELYTHRVYRALIDAIGVKNLFILSAGWGLVRGDYLLPDYDITFSTQPKVPKHAKRSGKTTQAWHDFNHLEDTPVNRDTTIHFFGSPEYLKLFYQMSAHVEAKKVIHHKARLVASPGYVYCRFDGRARTNWHYIAAAELIDTCKRETP